MTPLLLSKQWQRVALISLAIHSGVNIVEGGRAPQQHSGYHRNLVDLQVPFFHGYHEDAPQTEVHFRELQEGGNFPAPKVPTFSVFSALYDSILGEVRVSAEVYPLEVCESITTCQLDGESGHYDIPATGRAPFDTWGVEQPQLRECFVDCKLPQPGLKLDTVHLRDADDELVHANMLLEEIHHLGNGTTPKKAAGLCVGPVFSGAPTFLGGGYMHTPGSYRALSIDTHRLIRWKVFHPSPWSLHYYGQWLIYNDCLFRWRHHYEYILFVDRDEFLHFPGKPAGEVELGKMIAQQFKNDTASVVFFGALHNVRCLTRQVPLLGTAAQKAALIQPRLNIQVYEGYDLWGGDKAMPDFRNCSISYHGPGAGRACHPKSLVRPLAVDLMNVHFMAGPAPGYEEVPHAVDPNFAYIKHLRCMVKPGYGTWEHNDTLPLCSPGAHDYTRHTSGGVSTCPTQIMMHTG